MIFDLATDWDRSSRTGPQPTSHTLRLRATPSIKSGLGDGVPLMVAIALDISGSMAGEKLLRSKRACESVVSLLREQDRLWLAGFSTNLEVVAENMPGASDDTRLVIKGIETLSAQGVTRTDVALQWIESCLQSAPDTLRVGILITDGAPTDPFGKHDIDTSPLLQMAGRLGQAGNVLCCVGLGNASSYNSALLTRLSDSGRGEFIYADTPQALDKKLSARLSTSQTIASSAGVLEIERLMPGISITSACRFRPDYLPLEPVDSANGYHIEIGAVRADVSTDILLNIDVPAPRADSWTGLSDLLSIDLALDKPLGPLPQIVASLNNSLSYAEAQRQNPDVEKDRLNWDINRYSDALLKVQQDTFPDAARMRKTGQLLTGMEQSARRAGNNDLADEVSAQVSDLRKTGYLDAHRATGLLTATRHLGTELPAGKMTGVLTEEGD